MFLIHLFLSGEGSLTFNSGWSVGKTIIIIVSFMVGTSKNKNIDHQVKETCAIISTQVTYENDHISLLRHITT